MEKILISMRVDKELWELAGIKLPCSRGKFFENQVRAYLHLDDPEEKIIKKIAELEKETAVWKEKLNSIQQEKQLSAESGIDFEEAMVTVNRLHANLGAVGRNQLRQIAKRCNIPYEELEQYCKECDIRIENFMTVPQR